MFESHISKLAEKQRSDCGMMFVQTGGIVYAGDLEWDLTSHSNVIGSWESLDLNRDQKVWRLGFYTYILPNDAQSTPS
jgi:hypothetical protein